MNLLYSQLGLLSTERPLQDGILSTITPQAIHEFGSQGTATEPALFRTWFNFGDSTGSRICQTREGYIGIFPPKVAEGDIVAAIQDFWDPVLLRKTGANYNNVGTSNVAGLINGEAADLVESGEKEVQEIVII